MHISWTYGMGSKHIKCWTKVQRTTTIEWWKLAHYGCVQKNYNHSLTSTFVHKKNLLWGPFANICCYSLNKSQKTITKESGFVCATQIQVQVCRERPFDTLYITSSYNCFSCSFLVYFIQTFNIQVLQQLVIVHLTWLFIKWSSSWMEQRDRTVTPLANYI